MVLIGSSKNHINDSVHYWDGNDKNFYRNSNNFTKITKLDANKLHSSAKLKSGKEFSIIFSDGSHILLKGIIIYMLFKYWLLNIDY